MDKDKFKKEVLKLFPLAKFPDQDLLAITNFGSSRISMVFKDDKFNVRITLSEEVRFGASGEDIELKIAVDSAMSEARRKVEISLQKLETMIKFGENHGNWR